MDKEIVNPNPDEYRTAIVSGEDVAIPEFWIEACRGETGPVTVGLGLALEFFESFFQYANEG